MASDVRELLRELDVREFYQILLDNNYYEIVFPFLLIFAVLYTVLSYVKIFQNKEGSPIKPVIFIISLVFALMSVWFETSPGYFIGDLFIMMFPNISALTIGILTLYIMGSLFGVDFLKGIFRKDVSAYIFFTIAAIGLGAIVFYVGIVIGIWDFNYLDTESYWNVIVGLALFILGIVFLVVGLWGFGIVLLFVVGTFVYNYGENNILEHFIDPVVFIMILVILLLSWMTNNKERKVELSQNLRDQEESIETYKKNYGGKLPKDFDSRVFDIISENNKVNKKEWKEKFGNEPWK